MFDCIKMNDQSVNYDVEILTEFNGLSLICYNVSDFTGFMIFKFIIFVVEYRNY